MSHSAATQLLHYFWLYGFLSKLHQFRYPLINIHLLFGCSETWATQLPLVIQIEKESESQPAKESACQSQAHGVLHSPPLGQNFGIQQQVCPGQGALLIQEICWRSLIYSRALRLCNRSCSSVLVDCKASSTQQLTSLHPMLSISPCCSWMLFCCGWGKSAMTL